MDGIRDVGNATSLSHHLNRVGSKFTVHVSESIPTSSALEQRTTYLILSLCTTTKNGESTHCQNIPSSPAVMQSFVGKAMKSIMAALIEVLKRYMGI